jgi:ribonuclease Z
MKPSKYRNVSAILVEMGQSKILMDCGEGSHIQIAEHYGYEQYEDVLLDIRIIFITHIHSDHNLGILDLISQRNAIIAKRGLDPSKNTLFLVLPANVVPWFDSFCQNI